jgi:hypothetical protein
MVLAYFFIRQMTKVVEKINCGKYFVTEGVCAIWITPIPACQKPISSFFKKKKENQYPVGAIESHESYML